MPREEERSRSRRPSLSRSGTSNYPKRWSEWSWDDRYGAVCRSREISRGELEVEIKEGSQDPERTPRPAPSSPSMARSDRRATTSRPPPSNRPPLSDDPYAENEEYTYKKDPVDQLSTSLAETTLDLKPLNSVPIDKVNVKTKDINKKWEDFDPDYKVEDGWKFKFGRVFKVLWSEPTGSSVVGATGATAYSERFSKFGEKFTHKVRRFVIVSHRHGHCICLPIMTYQGQGTAKRGVRPEDHAIIWTEWPALVGNEKRLSKAPIQVIPHTSQHKLEPASRLNYAKVYTIEYNVKVLFIGAVAKESEWELVAAYNDVHPPLHARGDLNRASSTRFHSSVISSQFSNDQQSRTPDWTPHTPRPSVPPQRFTPGYPPPPNSTTGGASFPTDAAAPRARRASALGPPFSPLGLLPEMQPGTSSSQSGVFDEPVGAPWSQQQPPLLPPMVSREYSDNAFAPSGQAQMGMYSQPPQPPHQSQYQQQFHEPVYVSRRYPPHTEQHAPLPRNYYPAQPQHHPPPPSNARPGYSFDGFRGPHPPPPSSTENYRSRPPHSDPDDIYDA